MLTQSLSLPCGSALPNRIGKAAMTEGLATAHGVPTSQLQHLYQIWSKGGAGLLLSGNIQIDRHHLERPGNVIIEGEAGSELRAALEAWTQAATMNGNHFWAQISHAGRQTPKLVNSRPKAPSAIKLELPGGQFGQPEALSEDDIDNLILRFAETAKICRETGFTGVQLHAAHGYLLSAFLNPLANQRTDQFGGSLENRARFLMTVISKTRAKVGPDFPIAVKLNSADFQKGGFAFADSVQVAQWLADAGVDLLEISGGNYEQPKLLGMEGLEPEEEQFVAASTRAREAYFVDFAQAMQNKVSIPLMVTGGFRSAQAIQQALQSGAADVIGLGRPMCTLPDAPTQLINGLEQLPRKETELALLPRVLAFLRRVQMIKVIDSFAVQNWFYGQIFALARNGQPDPTLSPLKATIEVERANRKLIKQSRSQTEV